MLYSRNASPGFFPQGETQFDQFPTGMEGMQSAREPISVQRFDGSRILLINFVPIRFTPAEYRLMLLLLSNRPCSYHELLGQEVETDPGAISLIQRHIKHVRRKLSGSELMIHGITGYGYWLFPLIKQE